MKSPYEYDGSSICVTGCSSIALPDETKMLPEPISWHHERRELSQFSSQPSLVQPVQSSPPLPALCLCASTHFHNKLQASFTLGGGSFNKWCRRESGCHCKWVGPRETRFDPPQGREASLDDMPSAPTDSYTAAVALSHGGGTIG